MVLKKSILLAAFGAVLLSFPGCTKSKTGCEPNPPSTEAPKMLSFASANGITATAHASGLFYEIIDPGSGATPTASSKIYITYIGKLLDGTTFDQQNNSALTGWMLGGLIEGWRIGIPLIKKGGHIKLIVPSALAYGCEPYQTLPGSAVLYFDIILADVQ